LVKLKFRKIKPVIVEGQLCDHEMILPDTDELHELLAPIFERTPEPVVEVILEEDDDRETVHLNVPLSGEFPPDYITPPAKEGVERIVFRTRLKTQKIRRQNKIKDN
jgi:hypothetical protein